jgi:hypothetical protein
MVSGLQVTCQNIRTPLRSTFALSLFLRVGLPLVCRACCCYSARRSQRSCGDGSSAAQAPPPTSTGPIYLQAAARREEPGPPSRRVARGIDPGKGAEAALSRALDALREFGLTNSVAAGEGAAHE